MSPLPIVFQWDDHVMRPATNWQAHLAGQQFAPGKRYRLVEEAERSTATHNHEFAWLKEAWNSMPDPLVDQYPNPEILRKHALIAKGHCTMVQHECPTVAEAERLAAILKPYDAYAIVRQRGRVVTVYTAVSQARNAMSAAMFQATKNDIIDFVADLLGVEPETLSRQTESA